MIIVIIFFLIDYAGYECIEKIRFSLYKNSYEKTATALIEDNKDKKYTDWTYKQDISYWNLASMGEVQYKKYDGACLVYFPTYQSFSSSSGYIYFENKEMENYLKAPVTAGGQAMQSKSYEEIEYLTENWAFIRLY